MNKAMRTRRPHAMMIARLRISPDPSGSESGLSAEDNSVTVTALLERHLWNLHCTSPRSALGSPPLGRSDLLDPHQATAVPRIAVSAAPANQVAIVHVGVSAPML